MYKGFKSGLLPVLFFTSIAPAIAATPGPYAGLAPGFSNNDGIENVYKQHDGGLAGRGFVGYNFNHYLGIEANYTRFANTTYWMPQYPGVTLDLQLSAVSVVAKGYLPVSVDNRFNLYGLFGIAQVYSQFDGRYNLIDVTRDNDNGLVPTLGFGASYELNHALTASVEISSFGDKDVTREHYGFPNTAIASFGLSYKF